VASDVKSGEVLTPKQLHQLTEAKAVAEARTASAFAKKVEQEKLAMRAAFMTRDVRPDVMERVMAAVKLAAEQGQHEILIVQFPSGLLKDSGRRINNFEPDWPESLDGFAKRAFETYQTHLQPHGYKLRAQVVDYPDGMPGEIGLFLSW
jgi:hypothetical protein